MFGRVSHNEDTKKGVSIRDFLRFATTYAIARNETLFKALHRVLLHDLQKVAISGNHKAQLHRLTDGYVKRERLTIFDFENSLV